MTTYLCSNLRDNSLTAISQFASQTINWGSAATGFRGSQTVSVRKMKKKRCQLIATLQTQNVIYQYVVSCNFQETPSPKQLPCTRKIFFFPQKMHYNYICVTKRTLLKKPDVRASPRAWCSLFCSRALIFYKLWARQVLSHWDGFEALKPIKSIF